MSLELSLERVSFHYTGIAASSASVLRDVTFTLAENECTAIVGPSGSGKTTLIQHFTGLLRPTRGRVLVDGADIHSKKYSLTALRRRIGLVFQFPEAQLFEETVYRDVAFGPTNLGLGAEEIDLRVRNALTLTGLEADAFAGRSPFRLSEGEKRKVAIAGVLAMQPEMIILDEPTAGLDPVGVQSISAILESLVSRGTTPVFITHHMDLVAEIAQRVLVLSAGSVIFDGTPEQLFQNNPVLEEAKLDLPNFIQEFAAYRPSLPPALQSVRSYRQLVHRLQQHLVSRRS
ncbi:MAG TPA: ATP-binding cassette domain-containing protein [bacterium]|nr:ATP-binding cassette domain-containing protein [bacterium]HPN34604.1 ATP-binding cassette domain-containing protein [bacterium]